MQIEKDSMNECPKFQVPRLVWKPRYFGLHPKVCNFKQLDLLFQHKTKTISSIILTNEVVCIWLLTGQSQPVIVIAIGNRGTC